jgi:hypothetical protein
MGDMYVTGLVRENEVELFREETLEALDRRAGERDGEVRREGFVSAINLHRPDAD